LLSGGGSSNQEMSDATSYLEGVAPYSSYYDFPGPDGEENFINGYDISDAYSGETTLSDLGYSPGPSNQGNMFDYGEIQDLDNNIDIGTSALYDLEVEANQLKEQQQLTVDAVNSLDTKKQELLGLGLTENDPDVIELNQQIEMQIAIASDQDSRLNELSDKSTNLAAEVERQIVKKEGLTGVGGI
jgi:hypothetical protein